MLEVIAPSPKGDLLEIFLSFSFLFFLFLFFSFFLSFFFFFQIKQRTRLHLNDLAQDVSRKAPSIVSIVREKSDNSFIP